MNDNWMCFEGKWRLTGNFYKLAVREKVAESMSHSNIFWNVLKLVAFPSLILTLHVCASSLLLGRDVYSPWNAESDPNFNTFHK